MVGDNFEIYIYEMVINAPWLEKILPFRKCCLSEMAENSPQFILNTLFLYKKPVYKKLESKDQKFKKLLGLYAMIHAKVFFDKFSASLRNFRPF